MSSPDFADYLREYEAEGVGELLYGLILGLVKQVVQRYPPAVYSPNRIWDEDAITSLCHDFTMEKLLGAGWLEHYLLTQETTGALRQVLGRDFRHFLISRRRRSEYSNLFGRVRRMLREDPSFQVCHAYQDSSMGTWGLENWANKEIAQRLDEVVEAMFTVALPPLIRYRPDSKKLSHLLCHDDLRCLLETTFRTVDKYIGLVLIMEGLRYRLGLLELAVVSLDEPVGRQDENGCRVYADIIPDLANPETELTSAQIAEDIFERLNDRQRDVLALRLSSIDPTLNHIGDCLGVSKSTVHSELAIAAQHISAADVTHEEAEKVLSYLSELCVCYLERTDGNAH